VSLIDRLSPYARFRVDRAIALLLVLALAAYGATLAPGGWRDPARRPARLVAAALLAGAAIALAWPALFARRGVDLRPVIRSDADLVGAWREGADTLELRPDGSYRCAGPRCTGVGPSGRWRRYDGTWLETRWADGHRVAWRVVGYRDRLRLALWPEDGTREWDGQLFFGRERTHAR
jgi:hypothetical protein